MPIDPKVLELAVWMSRPEIHSSQCHGTEAKIVAKALTDAAAEIAGLREQLRVAREALASARAIISHREDDREVCFNSCPACKIDRALAIDQPTAQEGNKK